MRSLGLILSLATLASVATARLTCTVKNLGGGQDDGPNILAAFQRCAKNGKVTLDKYYVVDTLLLTTGLDDVEIELSGTSEYQSERILSSFFFCCVEIGLGG